MDKIPDGTSDMRRTSSGEETSTQHDSTPRNAHDDAYYMPIGGSATRDSENAEYSGKEEMEDLPKPKRVHTYIEENDRVELQRIATGMSGNRVSMARAEESFRTLSKLASIPHDDPALNPQSPSFDLVTWVKWCMKSLIAEGHQIQRTGIVFKCLSVSGSGSALQLQNTVASILLAPLRIGELFSFRKKEHKQILRNFNGVLNSGELLIVLGRPGSGCSTLLKSMTGQLHGLQLDEKSTIHYDGIPQVKMIKEFKGEAIYNQEVCKAKTESHSD
jgi:hypothetical protein